MENEIKELEDMTATEIVKEGLKKGVSSRILPASHAG